MNNIGVSDNKSDEIIEESASASVDVESDDKQIADGKRRTTATDALVAVKKRPRPFQNFKRRLPSYTRVSQRLRRNKIDNKEEHQPLAMNERGNHDKDEQNRHDKYTISPTLMKRLSNSKEVIDPSHYPLEQITDAEYGRSYSDALDHSNVNHSNLKQEKRKLITVISAITLVLIISAIIGSTTGRIRSGAMQHGPADLENVCSITNISTQYGYKKCEEACDAALVHLGASSSTTPCEVLHHISITRAPNNLGSLCSDASIASPSGFIECHSACLQGQCCFTSTPFESHGISTNTSPSITQSCSESHQDVCKGYTPCLSMQGMESPTDLVNQKCALDNIRYLEGRQDCEVVCKPRSCCFAKFPEENCIENFKPWCDEYKACQVLDNVSHQDSSGTDVDIIRPSGSVNTLCTIDNISYIKGREDCESVCAQGKCCSSKEDNCLVGNESRCDEFKVCAILHRPSVQSSGDNNGGVQKSSTTDKCHDFQKMSSIEFAYCEASCKNASCCFFDDILCDNIDCTHYQYCNEMGHEIKDLPLIGSPIGDAPSGLVEIPKTNNEQGLYPADEMCSIEYLSMKDGIKLCQVLCSKHMCCFGGKEACTNRDDCPVYQACGILVDQNRIVKESGGALAFNFNSICSLDALGTIGGQNACKHICQPYLCCSTGKCEHPDYCDTAAATVCNRVYPEKGKLITPMTSETSLECTQLCPKGIPDYKNRAKCNITEIGSCSCSYNEDTSCSLYCDELGTWVMVCDRNPSFPNTVYGRAPPPVDLEIFCSKELITSKDPFQRTKCLDICHAADCCKEETCAEEVSFCNSYVFCRTVWEEVAELKKSAAETSP